MLRVVAEVMPQIKCATACDLIHSNNYSTLPNAFILECIKVTQVNNQLVKSGTVNLSILGNIISHNKCKSGCIGAQIVYQILYNKVHVIITIGDS